MEEYPQTVNNNNTIINVVPLAFLSQENYEQFIKTLPDLLHIALTKTPCKFDYISDPRDQL